jgi:hypothetical protein
MFTSVLAPQPPGATWRHRGPPGRLARRAAFGGQGEGRKDQEVLGGEHHCAENAGQTGGKPQIGFPHPAQPGPPQEPSASLSSHPAQLNEGVIHVERLVMEHRLEHRPRLQVPVENLAIGLKVPRGGLFRKVQESQQGVIGFLAYPKIVQTPLARRQPGRSEGSAPGASGRGQKRQSALTKQIRVPALIAGVNQKQPAKDGIAGEFGGANKVAAAIGLNLGEGQEFAPAPGGVTPDPPVDG